MLNDSAVKQHVPDVEIGQATLSHAQRRVMAPYHFAVLPQIMNGALCNPVVQGPVTGNVSLWHV